MQWICINLRKNVFCFSLKSGKPKLNKSQIFRSIALQWLNCILPPGSDLEQSLVACVRCNRVQHSILMQFAHFEIKDVQTSDRVYQLIYD